MRAEGAAAVPVRCWQRVQWHQDALTSGASISKRTAPQPQPPVWRGVEAVMPEA